MLNSKAEKSETENSFEKSKSEFFVPATEASATGVDSWRTSWQVLKLV